MMAGGRVCGLFSWTLFVVYVTVGRFGAAPYDIGCLNPNRKPVDWFLVYKTPQDPRNPQRFISQGVGFYYMDSHRPELTLSATPINGEGHALYNTLQQIYLNYFVVEYGMYNDDPPSASNKTRGSASSPGITKGVYAFDKRTGFWLITSIPKFPPPKSKGYSFNMEAVGDGHLALCVTMNDGNVPNLQKIFKVTQPRFYDGRGSNEQVPAPQHLTNTLVLDLYTHDLVQLKYLAKGTADAKDVYPLVASSLQMNLLVQTLRSSAGVPSKCSDYKVINISKVKFPDTVVFPSLTRDRSKWAVTEKLGRWICVGDLDRVTPSFGQSGGVLCMVNYSAWKVLHNITAAIESC
ncbi:plancitoxin-1-like [Crassostrea virginica]